MIGGVLLVILVAGGAVALAALVHVGTCRLTGTGPDWLYPRDLRGAEFYCGGCRRVDRLQAEFDRDPSAFGDPEDPWRRLPPGHDDFLYSTGRYTCRRCSRSLSPAEARRWIVARRLPTSDLRDVALFETPDTADAVAHDHGHEWPS